MQFLVNITQWK